MRHDKKARTDVIMRNNAMRCQTYLAMVSRPTNAVSNAEDAEGLVPHANRHDFFAK